ncbi:NUDIX domain-containing protein [Kineococcus sp. SYSU DK005]|uniref:NUDIX domain-containing protein n=1 Tax=Kineococcus sp. SYSU DK005 TaxID=3383126 RepID=UPI003D7E6F51
MATPRVAAGVIYRDGQGRILLAKPTYKDGWDLPGGYVEPGESPLAAARREVVEELGTELPVAGLLLVDWAPHPSEGDKLLFVFDGGTLSPDDYARITPDGEEIDRVDFHDPAALDQLMPDRLVRRVRTALRAGAAGAEHYAEHGAAVLATTTSTS